MAQPPPRPPQTEGQHALMVDLARRFAERNSRVFVVHIPSRDELLGHDTHSATAGRKEALAFAELLGARFVDGAQAFEGMTPQEIRDHWLPYDGHWAQAGSNRFGRYMVNFLSEN